MKFRHKITEIRYDEATKRNGKRAGCMVAAFIFLTIWAIAGAEKSRNPNRALPYRGMRMSGKNSVFFVTKIEHEDERDNTAEIKIKFNLPADPRTLQRSSIRINGKPLPPQAHLSFNKAGNKLKILLPASFIFDMQNEKKGLFHLDLPEAKSFNRLPLHHSHFGDMRCNKEYKFIFSNPAPRKPPMEKPLKEPDGENLSIPYGEYLRSKRYTAKQYFSDGDLNILYYAVPIKPAPLSLPALFERLIDDTKAYAPGVTFNTHIELQTIHTDAELLHQACTIIISNSVKFAGRHAHITLSTHSFLEETPPPTKHAPSTEVAVTGTICISIADNGPGIGAEAVPHIFERFYREDAAHVRNAGGAGLGLSIVKSIMHTLGGSVYAESSEGKDTVIVMQLPA
ncbi:MAG: sensor histidine kinase [Treponema sp.]